MLQLDDHLHGTHQIAVQRQQLAMNDTAAESIHTEIQEYGLEKILTLTTF
jgi:hypothetical protein